ncbi:MAG: DUF3300 domain-containing protein [Gammaproteobacteria bacterium]|jgi:hypothetical protein|nr:DUF3300 domain-containing protein [Gammaproteobacteria bacterium]
MNTLTQTWLFTRARWLAATGALLAVGLLQPLPARSEVSAEPPRRTVAELEELVAPVALYPDDLVAVLLPAASYPLQLVQAARVLDTNGTPDTDWDESVVAVMNYPEVVEFLNEDLDWTYSLGLAFVNQESEVLDAIQRFRADAMAAGNLRTDEYQVVTVSNGLITIRPQDEKAIYVPYYEPQRVVVRQPVPVYYYHPVARPVYYYPYPASWVFNGGFYGVGSYFSLGWTFGGLNVFYSNQVGHPFFGRALAPRHYFYRPRVRPVRVVGVGPGLHHYRPGRAIVRHPAPPRVQRRVNAAYRSGVRDGRQLQRRREARVNNQPAANRPRAAAPTRMPPRAQPPRNTAPRVGAPRGGDNRRFTNNDTPARRADRAVNRSPQERTARNAARPGRVGQESAARRRSSERNAAPPPAANRGAPQAGRQPVMRAPRAERPRPMRAEPARRAAPPAASRPRVNRGPARADRAMNARANRNMNRNMNRGSKPVMRGGGR